MTSCAVLKEKKKPTPGPQSAPMIQYLEGLANEVLFSQLEEKPCLSSAAELSCKYSNPISKSEQRKSVIGSKMFRASNVP